MRRVIALTLCLSCAPAWAAGPSKAYVMIAPPRQSQTQEQAVYGRIAQFLAQATGAPIRFRYTSNWLTYMAEVHGNKADIYFDGPSFVGWRIARWHDHAAVALSGHLKFVLVAKKGGPSLSKVSDLVGRSVCAFSPPNLATLTLDSSFTNPERRPYIVVIHSFREAARNVIDGNCMAALEPLPVYKHQSAQFPGKLRLAGKIPGLPNQAFSLSNAMPSALREKIIAALLSPAGRAATAPLRDIFGHKQLVRVHDAAYLPYRKLLKAMVGF